MATVRKLYHLAAAFLISGAALTDLSAQGSPFDPAFSAQAASIQEHVDCFTDRSLYISGEPVRFRARVKTTGLPAEKEWSRILYVELLSASGIPYAGGKFRIRDRTVSGEIRIPVGLLTGSYYMRSYTRWMRNRDPSRYACIPLRIVNPDTPEVAEPGPEEQGTLLLEPVAANERALELSMGSSFGRSDTVTLDLSKRRNATSGKVNGCLSVVPLAVRPGEVMRSASDPDPGDFRLSFLPDLFGITLSGKAPIHSRVHFTTLGEQGSYLVAAADPFGGFAVTLPWSEGILELLVQPEDPGPDPGEVRIDQDYDPRILALGVHGFRLTGAERQALTIMARNVQLSEIYKPAGTSEEPNETGAAVPFYGTADFSLNMDDYVLLPTLEEVFINLLPDVTPVTRRNRTELLIASENPAISMFPPLLLIDQVPVLSLERFLEVPPGKIGRIDVVTDVYLKGDKRYGGIINLRTREGNMAGVDLPDRAFFVDIEGLYPQPARLSGERSPGDKLPDTRNTLLWMPELVLDEANPLSVDFVAPDFPGEYVVLFRGWDREGACVWAETRFLVE